MISRVRKLLDRSQAMKRPPQAAPACLECHPMAKPKTRCRRSPGHVGVHLGDAGRYRIWLGFEECGAAMLRLRGESMWVGESSGGCLGLEIAQVAPKQGQLL